MNSIMLNRCACGHPPIWHHEAGRKLNAYCVALDCECDQYEPMEVTA